MKVLILNGSPKKKGSSSKLFSSILRLMLAGCEVRTCRVCGVMDYEAALEALTWAEAVVISAPLYVDAAPAHIMEFLEKAEKVCREKKLQFRFYAISNSGFIEGKQNAGHFRVYEGFCRRAGVVWGGGVGLGGGTMLYWMCILTPLSLLLDTVSLIADLRQNALTAWEIMNYYSGTVITLFLCMGLVIGLFLLAGAIRGGRSRKNFYTRVLIPACVFLVGADLFMLVLGLCKGVLPHQMLRREKTPY